MRQPLKPNSATSDDNKRTEILIAAMEVFSNGYKKATTDEIVKAAGVSKGLLFHHFGSKEGVYSAAYQYAAEVMLSEFYHLINYEQRDILERWRQIALLKKDLIAKYPAIFTFLAKTVSDDKEIALDKELARQTKISTEELYPKLFHDVDRSLFKDEIDVDTAINVIIFTIEGYAQSQADDEKTTDDYYSEYEKYLADLDKYIRFFRNIFYKQEESYEDN